ncbi:MAG: hypothetical protein AAF242_00120 [Bacteroidota bacterium]
MSSAADFFKQLQIDIPILERQILRDVILVEANRFHEENFSNGGFTDVGLKKWDPRSSKDKNEKRSGNRALLVDSSTLKDTATRGRVVGDLVMYDFRGLVYAGVHNEGLRAGRGEGFDMPKRQFVGKSQHLENRIKTKATALLNKTLQ